MPSGTKTISTTITTGYTLLAGYTGLSITSTGAVTGVAGTKGAANSGSAGTAGTLGLSVSQAIVAGIDGAVTGGIGGAGGSKNGAVAGAGGAGATGAYFGGGGTLTNTGKIFGGAGGAGGGTNSSGTNGSGGAGGLALKLGGASMSLVNTGTIQGGAGGAVGTGGAGGAAGALGAGVSILAGGAIVNGSAVSHTALIKGSSAIYAGSAAAVTITNFASIVGTTGNSVTFKNSSDRLITETSAVFTGAIAGGGGALEIGSGTDTIAALGGAGTLSGSTTGTFSGFGSYQVDGGAAATLTGTATLSSSQTFTDNGALTLAGTFNNAGSVAGASTVTNLGVAATGVLNNKGTISGGTIGVSVAAGGYISNQIGSGRGLISGSVTGVAMAATGAATVFNDGKITGGTYGVVLGNSSDRLILADGSETYGTVVGAGGTLELKNTGTTTLTDEVLGLGGTADFVAGLIAPTVKGFATYVVDGNIVLTTSNTALTASETLINNGKVDVSNAFSSAGQVTSGAGIDALTTTNGTIINTGSIVAGTGGRGLYIKGGSSITNGSSIVSNALIQGSVGVYDHPAGIGVTIVNWATIAGTTGTSVWFNNTSDVLKVESGAAFVGFVAGGGGSLEIAGGKDTISGFGGTATVTPGGTVSPWTFSNFGRYTIDSGAALYLSGFDSLIYGHRISNFGTLGVTGTLANAGVIFANFKYINGVAVGSGGTLTNTGTIYGAYLSGVSLGAGGSVTNAAIGTINGRTGVYISGAGTLANAGSITSGRTGVSLAAGGSLINSGFIQGGSTIAVYAGGAATVSNSGYIKGVGSYGIKFKSTGDRLILNTGAKSRGTIAGGGGALEFASGNDTLTGLGSVVSLSGDVTGGTIVSFGSYQVDSGATLTLTGTNKLAAGQTLTNKGSLVVAGSLANAGSIANQGTFVVTGSMTNTGSVTGDDGLDVAGGSVSNSATITGDSGAGVGVGAGGTLVNTGAVQGVTGANGVTFSTGGGFVTNSGTGLIEGATGVYAGAGIAATVSNAATITGDTGDAVQFKSSSDRLIVQSGGTFIGAVAGGGGALEIASGSDTISGLGGTGTLSVGAVATFSGFGAYSVTNTGTLHLTGNNTLASGQTLANPSGGVFLDGALANAGRITSSSAGGIWVDAGGTLQNSGSIVSSTYGVQLNSTVAFTNAVGGYISAGVQGVVLSVANATVVNYGLIKGGLLDSVNLTQSSDKLVVESGSTLVGLATAVSGGTLELGGGAVTLSGLGNTATLSGAATGTFTGFSYYTIDAGATLTFAGVGNTLTSGKTLSATSVTLAPSAYLANRGQFASGLVAGKGATVSNASTVTGAVSFSGAGELIQRQGGTIGGSVSGGGGTLQIASGYDTITGLGGAGTLSGMGSDTFSGFGIYLISAPATLHLTGSNTLAASQSIANPGGRLFLDGTLGNAGTISDVGSGGIWVDAYGALNNSGTIQGGSYGVSLHSAHAMTNVVGGYIGGGSTGVVLGIANATLVNAGSIKGGTNSVFLTSSGDRLVVESGSTLTGLATANTSGVLEIGGGTVTLTGMGGAKATLSGDTAGTITGFSSYVVDSGVSLTLAGSNFLGVGNTLTGAGVTLTGTLTNAFYISGASGDTAVSVAGSGVLINNGTIVGGLGAPAVYGSAGATVTNNGTISGTGGAYAVKFGGAGTLIAGAYSKFVGSVAGGGGRLELAGGNDTISGLGGLGTLSGTIHANFGGFGSYKFDAATAITLTGVNSLAAGAYLNDVSLITLKGDLTNSGAMNGGPLIVANLATFTNAGTFGTNSGIGVSVGGLLDNSGAITMSGAQSAVSVSIGGAATVINSGTITAGTGDAVDLGDKADRLVIGKGADFVGKVVASGGVLEVSGGSDSLTGLGVTITASGDAQGTFAGFGGYRIDSGATVTVTGAKNTIDSGVTVANYGVLDLTGSLTNDGYIFGDDAMDVGAGGSFTNHGSLASASGAVIGISGGGQVTNLGTFSGASGAYGVSFSGAGTLVNGSASNSTAFIFGSFGVYAGAGGAATVTNFATIGGGVYAAVFKNKADRLIVESGAYFESGTSGGIAGGGGTLELAGGSDTISSLGGTATLSASASGTFSGFGTYVVDSGVVLTLSGSNTLASGKSLTAPGRVYLQGILTNSGYVGGGAYGVIADIASTVANYGVINGSTDAVKLTSTDDRLIVGYGSSFGTGGGAYGTILGGGGRMEFAGGYHTYVDFTVAGLGTAQGTLSSGSTGYFSSFGHYTVDGYAHLILTGANTIGASQSVYNLGQIELSGDLTNAGTLQGHAGVSMDAGATLTNTGQMFTYLGPVITGGGVVINSSTIDGHNGANGIEFRQSGALTNQAGGYVFGNVGVYAQSGYAVTVTNAGTISGRYSYAVEFNDPSDRLIADSGAKFYYGALGSGAVSGGGGTLELAGGSDTITGMGGASDTLSGSANGKIGDFGVYQVDSGVTLTLAGYNVLNGSLIGAGEVDLSGTLVNLGYIGGRAVGVNVGASSTLTNYGTIEGATYSVELTAASARLRVGAKAKFVGPIDGGGGRLLLYGGTDTLTGLGGTATLSGSSSGTLSGFGYYFLQSGVTLTLSGANTLAGGSTLSNIGSLELTGSLDNYGAVSGVHGIELIPGGSLFNDGQIGTGSVGVYGAGSVRNTGSIHGKDDGVDFSGDGYLLNAQNKAGRGTVSGAVGVYAGASAVVTVNNQGVIQGIVHDSVQFKNSADRLIVGAGASFFGAIAGGYGTLELAAGADTITGLGATATLSGAASATFSGFGAYVVDAGAALTLSGASYLAAGQTLTAPGEIDLGGSLTNYGYIGAQGLYAGPAGAIAVANYGTISGAGAYSLQFKNSADILIVGAGAAFVGEVDGGGGTLMLAQGSGTLTGLGATGTVTGAASLQFANFQKVIALGSNWALTGTNSVAAGQTLYDEAATLANGGVLTSAGGAVFIEGAVENSGTIALDGGFLRLFAAGGSLPSTATLSGGGVVSLTGSKSVIVGGARGSTLTNADNTIIGAGFLGSNSLSFVNEAAGVVEASGGTMVVATAGETLTNDGTIEAASGGKLALIGTTVDQSGGTIIALAGGRVNLQDDQVVGGVVGSSGTGVFNVTAAGGKLDGVTIAGVVQLLDGISLTLDGTIDNGGKLNVSAKSTATRLIIGAGGVSLTGGGQVNLSNSADNLIVGAAATDTLTNVSDRISGAGDIGDGSMILDNEAVIVNAGSQALVIDTGANVITNSGTILVNGAGGVIVKSAVNNSGDLFAVNGTLTLEGAVTGTGSGRISTGTLDIAAAFAENVIFAVGSTGVLKLTDWTDFTGRVIGLSTSGANSIDLAGFSATAAKASYHDGVLTVTNGASQTARINLAGPFTSASTFTLTSDGAGGLTVKDPPAGAATSFSSAMASFGASASSSASSSPLRLAPQQPLVAPHG